VLPDSTIERGSLLIDDDGLIEDVWAEPMPKAPGSDWHDLTGRIIVPGFIDVHVHGVEGCDTLATADAAATLAAKLPKYGVTGFCPTTVACPPAALRRLLDGIRATRLNPVPGHAAVLPAHLESNFINPDFRGAQPVTCLRRPTSEKLPGVPGDVAFSGLEILDEIAKARPEVGIITMAPEMDGGMELVRSLTDAGHIVSLGHSAATYEQGLLRHRRRRPARHAHLQSHAAVLSPRAWTHRRHHRQPVRPRRARVRRLPRASRRRADDHRGPRSRTAPWRSPTAPAARDCPSARRCRSAATPSRSAAKRPSWTTGRWRAAR
jgi:N-acetylglucosamine-6-phosphate deacetylase